MAESVKDIGRRQAYDILQSRKPRLHAMRYGENGFARPWGRHWAILSRSLQAGKGAHERRCCP